MAVTVLRGRVVRLEGGRPHVEVPDLGVGYSYGPLEVVVPVSVVPGARVLVASVSDLRDDLVVVGVYGAVASGGGPEVGAWENDKTVTFTEPAWTENDRQASPLTLPPTRPAAPQVTFTITAGMLVTASDAADTYPVGFDQMLIYSASANHSASSGSGSLSAELIVNGAVRSSGTDPGHTNVERGNIHLPTVGLQVGDVVEFRAWYSVVGSTIDWTAFRCFPTRIGKGPGEGGARYLYRDVKVLATSAPMSPTTTLSFLGTVGGGSGNSGYRLYQSDVDSTEEGVQLGHTYLSGPTYGFMRARGGDFEQGGANISASNVLHPWAATYPSQIQFDRIALPPPP